MSRSSRSADAVARSRRGYGRGSAHVEGTLPCSPTRSGTRSRPHIARWHGRRRIERFIERLYHAAKEEDSGALVTYVHYPSTEYLQLPFVDFTAFNVYLEETDRLDAYLARLQNLAGDSPLVVTELGLDSRRHGERGQAIALGKQVRTTFAAGCAGAFVFAWTDEWHRGGLGVEDWDFGLTDRVRRPKEALEMVREAFADVPFPAVLRRPRISVAVCTHNGAATLPECLAALRRLDYPDYEVLVVDDGSTDGTPEIARAHGRRRPSPPTSSLTAGPSSAPSGSRSSGDGRTHVRASSFPTGSS